MAHIIEGGMNADGMRVAAIVGRFNSFITDKLLEGAFDCLRRHGASEDDFTVIKVPGAFEIPAVARRVAASNQFDAVVCLGCVIRGGTDHYEYVAGQASRGVAEVALGSAAPVLFGILTVDNIEQAIERSGTKMGNKGADVAAAAIEMVNLGRSLDQALKPK